MRIVGTEVTMDYYNAPPPTCPCERTLKTVGKEDLEPLYGRTAQFPAGGQWQSFPTAGECKEG